MKQKVINLLVIASVLTTGAALGLPGIVKWRTQEALSTLDATVLVAAAIIATYGVICGARLLHELFVGQRGKD